MRMNKLHSVYEQMFVVCLSLLTRQKCFSWTRLSDTLSYKASPLSATVEIHVKIFQKDTADQM